jgi:hypothetical protein
MTRGMSARYHQVKSNGNGDIMSGSRLEGDEVWSQRRRNWCRTALSFTTYHLSTEELGVESGIISQRFDTTKLFRIIDVTIRRSLLQRVFGLSTLVIHANDPSSNGVIVLSNVLNGFDVRKRLQAAVDDARDRHHVVSREFMDDGDVQAY